MSLQRAVSNRTEEESVNSRVSVQSVGRRREEGGLFRPKQGVGSSQVRSKSSSSSVDPNLRLPASLVRSALGSRASIHNTSGHVRRGRTASCRRHYPLMTIRHGQKISSKRHQSIVNALSAATNTKVKSGTTLLAAASATKEVSMQRLRQQNTTSSHHHYGHRQTDASSVVGTQRCSSSKRYPWALEHRPASNLGSERAHKHHQYDHCVFCARYIPPVPEFDGCEGYRDVVDDFGGEDDRRAPRGRCDSVTDNVCRVCLYRSRVNSLIPKHSMVVFTEPQGESRNDADERKRRLGGDSSSTY